MVLEELFALSKAYPLISFIVGVILFFIGLKIVNIVLKWFFWILAVVAVIVAFWMLFL
ncbi:MAG: hypothetical protein WCX73_03000 [Candidatus Pacearchaeota archaeon]|jgi:hypothetical protein